MQKSPSKNINKKTGIGKYITDLYPYSMVQSYYRVGKLRRLLPDNSAIKNKTELSIILWSLFCATIKYGPKHWKNK